MVAIRKSNASDMPAIEALYPAAFPLEDLLPLISELLALPAGVLSLVATIDELVVGHISFTGCYVGESGARGSLLAPLAVAPQHQQKGIGSALVREGHRVLDDAGVQQVFVLGDPNYYSRFGFTAEPKVLTPVEIPNEWTDAWQSLTLSGRDALPAGRLELPDVWNQPSLWQP